MVEQNKNGDRDGWTSIKEVKEEQEKENGGERDVSSKEEGGVLGIGTATKASIGYESGTSFRVRD